MEYRGNSLSKEEKEIVLTLINKMFERKDYRLFEALEEIIRVNKSLLEKQNNKK